MIDDRSDYLRNRYRMDRIRGSAGLPSQYQKQPAATQPTAPPSAQASSDKAASTSSFLSRLARSTVREGSSGSSARGANWIASSHVEGGSSPSANLANRLRWVETAFKKEEPAQPAQTVQALPHTPQPVQTPQSADAKGALCAVKARIQILRQEIDAIERDLSLLEQRIA